MPVTIDKFRGMYFFLSNFYPCKMMHDGIEYPTAEHAYQAAKTFNKVVRVQIADMKTAREAKRRGLSLPLRKDWEEVKVFIMEEILRRKFSDDRKLKQQLVSTGDATLVEGNDHNDTFWGVCNGVGDNQLGLLLMKIRNELAGTTG